MSRCLFKDRITIDINGATVDVDKLFSRLHRRNKVSSVALNWGYKGEVDIGRLFSVRSEFRRISDVLEIHGKLSSEIVEGYR